MPARNRRRAGRGRSTLVLLALVPVAIAIGVVVIAQVDDQKEPTSVVCEVNPADGDEAITAAIASCPNGSTVRFPARATYHQDGTILVRDRVDLVIDGNGSTFVSSAPNTRRVALPNWRLFKARNVTVRNMTAVGNFYPSGPRSLQTVSEQFDGCEFNAGFAVSGGDGVFLSGLKVRNVCGDGFGTYRTEFFDQTTPNEMPRNVHMKRVEAETTARHCFAPTQVDGIWIEDSICRDAWYGGLDAESDNRLDPIKNIHVLRSTFEGYNHFGLVVPVAGEPGTTENIEIRANKFLTGPDKNCNQSIQIGAYPDSNPLTFKNVVTEGNEVVAMTRAITYDHVIGGAIRNNVIRQLLPPGGSTVHGVCGEDRQVVVTNSTDVAVEGQRS